MTLRREWHAETFFLSAYTDAFTDSVGQDVTPFNHPGWTNMKLLRSIFMFRFQSQQLDPDLTLDLQPWPYSVVFSYSPSPDGEAVNSTEWQAVDDALWIEQIEWIPRLNTIGTIQTVVYTSPPLAQLRSVSAERTVVDKTTATLHMHLNRPTGAEIPSGVFTFIPVIGWMTWRYLLQVDR